MNPNLDCIQKDEMNMARRRGNNEGSIFKRKDGRWCAQVSLEGQRLTMYGKTRMQCRDWIRQTLPKNEDSPAFGYKQLTLERYVETWLGYKKLSQRPRTVHSYRRMAELYLLPRLGKMLLKDIRPGHIQQLYKNMREDGKGARTIQLAHVVLHCIFRQVVKEGILRRNPLEAVDRPRVETAEFHILNEEQVRRFMIFASESRYETLFHLALTSGMRKGELLGLKWCDVDWVKGVVKVQRQLQIVPDQGVALVAPKSKAGYRQIKLGQGSMRKLEAHQKQQALEKAAAGERWQEHGLIFTTSIGTYVNQSKVSRVFKQILQQAGLPDMRFHDLRHTSISILLANGTPVNTVQRRAGHSKASVTTDIYGHAMDRSAERAAQKIEEIITPRKNELQ